MNASFYDRDESYCRQFERPTDFLEESILEQKEKLDFLLKVVLISVLMWILVFVFFLLETRPLAPPLANSSFVTVSSIVE